ncbi:MAG: alpha/beta fold hydrolase [Gammaproteobacteria bacterium]
MKRPFVLVHGAWHGGWCWAEVAARLQSAGHRVFAPTLTGLADRAHLFGAQVGLPTHVEDVTRLIEWERLDGCVLVGHSYAGNVVSGVADRLRERVGHYVYLDAVVPPDDALRWRWADYNDVAHRQARLLAIAGAGAGVALPAPPPEDLGVFDPAQQQLLRDRLCPMPAGTYLHEILFEHGGSAGLPRTYVEVTEPPYAPMRATYARIRADASWKHRTLASGHDAMIISPGPLADLLLELAG